jgi:NodT family efflux transporter outer membrane factor (OMF) lipoprotein
MKRRSASLTPPLQEAGSSRAKAPITAFNGVNTALASLLTGAMLLLAGCASPGPQAPMHALAEAKALGAAKTATPWPETDWWAAYGDTQLSRLISQALQGQPALSVAQARVQQAQAAVDVAGAARGLQVNGSVDLTDQHFTQNGLIPPPLAGSVKWNNSAQILASWELDLFGRQRAALDASVGQWRAAQAEAQAARVLLSGNVAAGYFNLARLVEARDVASLSLQQREQVLALVRQRISAGLDTNVELRQAEGLIAQSRVEIESLAEAIGRARHALSELTGQGPHALDALSPALAPLLAQALPLALPADLLGRRADLVAQRWRVEAALRDVDVARAQFYPNVNLVAFFGLSSIGLNNFVEAGARTFGAGPALRLPIFDGGRLRANLGAKRAEVDAATEGYNGALLRALREVADEVSSLQSIERQQLAQAEATTAADAAYELSLQRFQAGLGNFLTVLTAQSNVLVQRRASTELKARHLASEVALIRSLGGGFEAAPDTLPSQAGAR